MPAKFTLTELEAFARRRGLQLVTAGTDDAALEELTLRRDGLAVVLRISYQDGDQTRVALLYRIAERQVS